MIRIETNSVAETEALGARLAGTLVLPAIVLLSGELGAGKTAFVRGMLRGLNAPPRKNFAPDCDTDSAIAKIWSRDSTEQGPAMSTTSSPPIVIPPWNFTIVPSGRKLRATSL